MRVEPDETGSFYLSEHETASDVSVRFGPLSTTIKSLLDHGFHLEIFGNVHRKRTHYKLRLRNGRETYLCRRNISLSELKIVSCLTGLVRGGEQLMRTSDMAVHWISISGIKETIVYLSPASTLVGNMTIAEMTDIMIAEAMGVEF